MENNIIETQQLKREEEGSSIMFWPWYFSTVWVQKSAQLWAWKLQEWKGCPCLSSRKRHGWNRRGMDGAPAACQPLWNTMALVLVFHSQCPRHLRSTEYPRRAYQDYLCFDLWFWGRKGGWCGVGGLGSEAELTMSNPEHHEQPSWSLGLCFPLKWKSQPRLLGLALNCAKRARKCMCKSFEVVRCCADVSSSRPRGHGWCFIPLCPRAPAPCWGIIGAS